MIYLPMLHSIFTFFGIYLQFFIIFSLQPFLNIFHQFLHLVSCDTIMTIFISEFSLFVMHRILLCILFRHFLFLTIIVMIILPTDFQDSFIAFHKQSQVELY